MLLATSRSRRRPRRAARAAAVPFVLLLSVACGSTVQNTGSVPLGGPAAASDGLSLPTVNGAGQPIDLGVAGSAPGPPAGVGVTGVAGAGGGPGLAGTSSSGAGGGGTSSSGAPGAGGTASGGPAPAQGKVPGIENGFIKIGVFNAKNTAAAYAAIGASALAGSGFGERMREALVKEINRTGIKGLKVRLVNYDIDQNDASTSSEVHQQKACERWTTDDRVFAAVAGEGEVLDACLAKAGVLEICGTCSISTYDDMKMNAVPLLFSPNGVAVDRQVEFYVRGLVEGGFFAGAGNQVPGPPKVGFLTYNDPVRKRQTPRLEAELQKQTGLTFAERGELPQPGGGEGDARYLNAIQNFMLQFKAKGVNRILMLDNSGQTAAYGMQTADKNGYFPRWGYNSTSGPGILLSAGVVPESELPGMTVVGWQPASDFGIKKGTQLPPGLPACIELFKKAGITLANDTDYLQAGSNCDAFLFFRDALAAAPGLSVQQFGAGAASLGAAFKTSVVYGANQGSGRRDNGSAYRVGAYAKECNCFRYVGPQRQI